MTWRVVAEWSAEGVGGPVVLVAPVVVGTVAIVGILATAAAWIDAREHRLPNALVLPCIPVVLLGLTAGAALGSARWLPAAVGAAAWAVPTGLLWLAGRGAGMGPGDAKIALPLGATLGWISVPAALLGVLAAFVAGGAYALVAMARDRRSMARTRVPFGPFLVIGWAAGLLAGRLLG